MSKGNCLVESCPNTEHAKGYCRKHYGRLWRGKKLEPDDPNEDTSVPLDLRSEERELEKMRDIYNKVVGLEGRIRWGKKIREQEELLRREKEARADKVRAEMQKVAVAATG